jgi:PAS domain S-box-containing protein
MTDQTRIPRRVASALLPAATAALAAGVFIAEAISPMKLAVAVFYVLVVLLAARFCTARGILLVGAGCVGLTVLAYALSGLGRLEASGIRLPMSVAVIGLTTFLITERKRAEVALRASEERWRGLFETSSAGMALFQLDGVCTAANPALQGMLGLSEDEIVGHSVLELNHPDERVATAEALARYRDGTLTERNVEKKYLKNDGTPVWLNITNTLVPATEAARPFLQAVYVDVTARVQAEAALRASEERWRTIFKSSSVGIATDPLDRGAKSVNPAFQRLLGYTESELQNLTVFDFTHEDDQEATRKLRDGVLTGAQGSYRLEKRYRRKDGTIVWADVSASVVPPPTDNTSAFLAIIVVDITDRKRAEEALRASEERWRLMFETSAAGMATARIDGVFTAANPALRRMLDRTEDEIVGRTAIQITHEDERTETENVVAKFRSGLQQEYHVEKRYLKKDGSPVWLKVTTTLVPATETADPFLQAIYMDITERVRAEEALRASEERWRAMVETAPIGIITFGSEHRRYVTANRSFQLMTGYTEDELRDLTPLEITHEDDRARLRMHVDQIVAGPQRNYRIEKRYRRKDGEVVWADISTFVVRETGSSPAFLGAVAVDITDRKRAEAALRASEERWRAMVETAPVGIATLDFEQKRYLTANKSFQRMTGYTAAELRRLTTLDVTHEDDRAAAQKRIDEGLIGVLQRKRYRRKDGEVIWADVTAFVVPATDSTAATFLGAVIVDITDRKRAEEALQQAQVDLTRLNRVMLLGEMTASIAHEVNQPISAVITNASAGLRWLGATLPDLREVRQALDRIVRDGARAGEVIARIRALVRKVPPHRDLLDINDTIREVISLTQTEMQRNGVGLVSRFPDRLPLVSADRVQLQQVMINLIVNAIEAMAGTAGRLRELTIASGTDDAHDLFVEVRDTGPGFEPEQLDQLFQSFYTTKPDGIGMGLAISRSIAEAHGGRLSAAPNKPRGAVFRLTLPIEEALSRSPVQSGH